MKKVLVALDLENGTETLLDRGSSLANAFNGELILVNVEPSLPGSEGESKAQAEEDIRTEFAVEVHQLHDIAEELNAANVNTRALIL